MQTFDVVTLRLVLAIAREGSLAKAAAQEHIATSAVSRRIADLEHGLGTPLLRRHSSGVSLTPAGQAFARHCERILDYFAGVKAELANYMDGLKGELRLQVSTSALLHGMPTLVAAFEKDYPDIRVGMREAYSDDALAALRDGRADLAVIGDSADTRGLETTFFAEDPIWLMAPKDHPVFEKVDAHGRIRFEDTLAWEHVRFHEGGVLDSLIARATPERKEARFHVMRFGTLRQCVEAGLGLGFFRQSGAAPFLGAKRLRGVRLADEWAQRTMVLAFHKGTAASPLVQRFVGFWRENASRFDRSVILPEDTARSDSQ